MLPEWSLLVSMEALYADNPPLALRRRVSRFGTAGCAHRTYYVAPPPPPPPRAYREVPPLVQLAEQNGYRAGLDEGARDAYQGTYHPRADRAFYATPGYDPQLGPFPPYRDAFRSAYLRGYDRNFNR